VLYLGGLRSAQQLVLLVLLTINDLVPAVVGRRISVDFVSHEANLLAYLANGYALVCQLLLLYDDYYVMRFDV